MGAADANYFCYVGTNGTANGNDAYYSSGLAVDSIVLG